MSPYTSQATRPIRISLDKALQPLITISVLYSRAKSRVFCHITQVRFAFIDSNIFVARDVLYSEFIE